MSLVEKDNPFQNHLRKVAKEAERNRAMARNNYMQRVGKSSCIRCDFETDEKMSFQEQDAAMLDHLTEKHPDWMTDGGASIIKARLPVSDKERNGILAAFEDIKAGRVRSLNDIEKDLEKE